MDSEAVVIGGDKLEHLIEASEVIEHVVLEHGVELVLKAREHGDLKENAEYHAAREQQGFCEGRINEIESKLGAAQIIDITELENTGKVIFGVTVTIIDVDTDEEKVYQIVGDDEANIKQGKLSVNSPIARGLIGREEGDVVQIDTPGGTREYEVDKVEHI